jgi:hypothetical protein
MSSEAIDILRSIDASLKQLLALSRVAKPKDIAPDSDLDGKWGDPIVKASDPRDWTGPSQKGKPFSQCSSEYLEMVASRLDYFADQAEKENKLTSGGKPVAPYNRRDAARARGWAKRIREGWKPSAHAGNGNGQAPPDDWGNQQIEPDDSFTGDDVNWG